MRFQRLQIPAFGPFTNLELSFPSREFDFHVIYGDNEAGKSSLLRAIRGLLFGIPGQSTDNFRHDYKELRLVGEIVNRDGRQLTFQRRKGNKNTLLDEEGNSLPDSALAPFLGSLDQAYFSAMFGLGGSELRDGAEQLLRGEGEIGSSLFSASLGATPIQRVLEALEEESGRLFKGRATSNVSIRPALARYKELQTTIREAIVSPDAWEKLENQLATAELTKQKLESELAQFEREFIWVSRCEDALPNIARLNEELQQLDDLPSLPKVASDFVERVRTASREAELHSHKVEIREAQLQQEQLRLKNCHIAPAVLTEADALDLLHQELGAYRTNKETLSKLNDKLSGIEPALKIGMQRLEISGDPEALEGLRLSSFLQMQCEQAAESLSQALTVRDENRVKLEELEQGIQGCTQELQKLTHADLTPLREALAEAAGATDSDRTLDSSVTAVEKLSLQAEADQSLVIGAPAEMDLAFRLAVPAPSTIRKFREQFDRVERDIEGTRKQLREEQTRVTNLQNELLRLERRGELPSEDSLQQARQHRDHGWKLVLADWKGDGAQEELEPGVPLDEAFPLAISRADKIADQLRLDAEAVAQADDRRQQIRICEQQISHAKESLVTAQDSLEKLREAWNSEWAATGITPQTPVEMEEWRERWVQFRETVDKLRNAEVTVQAKQVQLQHARKSLAEALSDSPDKPFSVLFEAARSRVQQGEEATGRRNAITQRLESLRGELEGNHRRSGGLREAFDTAEAEWRSQCVSAGLPEGTNPGLGLKLLQERRELLARYDNWKELSGQAAVLIKAIGYYEQQIDGKARALGITGDVTESQEAGLWAALSGARKAQAEYNQLVFQIQNLEQELSADRQNSQLAMKALQELMQLVQVDTPAQLEPLLADLEKREQLQTRIESLRETLRTLARGEAVDAFIARVESENAAELHERKSQLEQNRDEARNSLETMQAEIIDLRKEQQKLTQAGDAAASFRQQAESIAAGLQQDFSRFVRLRLATHFLKTQIERFRQENQGPLLEKTGRIFKQITRGAFDGLQPDYTEQDTPVMVGRRENGEKVRVEGMSDGSRDQLYLALRMAAMERYLEENEPMPLILDDLLGTFDNERSRAILPQLANLGRRTQVFLFTHHQHLAELCTETLVNGEFTLHRLSSASGQPSIS